MHKLAVILSSMGIEYFYYRMILLWVPMALRLKELFKIACIQKVPNSSVFTHTDLASTRRKSRYYRFLTAFIFRLRSLLQANLVCFYISFSAWSWREVSSPRKFKPALNMEHSLPVALKFRRFYFCKGKIKKNCTCRSYEVVILIDVQSLALCKSC